MKIQKKGGNEKNLNDDILARLALFEVNDSTYHSHICKLRKIPSPLFLTLVIVTTFRNFSWGQRILQKFFSVARSYVYVSFASYFSKCFRIRLFPWSFLGMFIISMSFSHNCLRTFVFSKVFSISSICSIFPRILFAFFPSYDLRLLLHFVFLWHSLAAVR